MQQEYSGRLLDRALYRLSPDVFFHPVWTHFVEAGAALAPEQIQSLLDAGDKLLLAGNLAEACQTLFICAFQQLRTSDYSAASSNIQRILVVAEQHRLPQVARWATWGAAAVCVRRGWLSQAAEHLEHLQSLLSQEQEWVLSNVIDMIRQALLSQTQVEVTAADQPRPPDAVLLSAFDYLLHWGTPRAAGGVNPNNLAGGGHTLHSAAAPSGSAGFRGRSLWQTIKRIVKGELRLKWVDSNGAAPQLHSEERSIVIARAPVTLLTPAAVPSLPQPNQPAAPVQKSDSDQLSTLKHDQLILPDQLPALEWQPEPDWPPVSAPDQPAVIAQPLAPEQLAAPDQKSDSDQLSTLNHDQLAVPDQLPAPEPQPDRLPVSNPDQPAVIDRPLAPDEPGSAAAPAASPSITAYLLGTFSFVVNAATVKNWPTGKGRAVFKYLLAHHDQPIPRDVLMDAFWPQAGPEAARNSLNVALYGLRQALKTVTDLPVVLFEEGAYGINPKFSVWVDVDEFDRHVQVGRRLEANGQVTRAAAEYEAASELYQGDFLAGDLYEEWPVLPRERLRVAYMDVLDHLSQIRFSQGQYAACVTLCQLLLTRDTCREDIHCLLMRCYSRAGQGHLALRQYQICVEALRTELEVDPASETTQLYEQIRRRGRV